MKIVSYSDLHLEFGGDVVPTPDDDADVMVLCGDIIVIDDIAPLEQFLTGWKKPVLYILGNHEYYGGQPMNETEERLIEHLSHHLPNVHVLRNEAIEIGGVNFFGGTMWTDFADRDGLAMLRARFVMNDYRRIRPTANRYLAPEDTVAMHEIFVAKVRAWFNLPLPGPRVVITHHAPTQNPTSRFKGSELQPAFNSMDMEALILTHEPALWLYGHTHECDDHVLGKTRIVSNQSGYPEAANRFECAEFDASGLAVNVAM